MKFCSWRSCTCRFSAENSHATPFHMKFGGGCFRKINCRHWESEERSSRLFIRVITFMYIINERQNLLHAVEMPPYTPYYITTFYACSRMHHRVNKISFLSMDKQALSAASLQWQWQPIVITHFTDFITTFITITVNYFWFFILSHAHFPAENIHSAFSSLACLFVILSVCTM